MLREAARVNVTPACGRPGLAPPTKVKRIKVPTDQDQRDGHATELTTENELAAYTTRAQQPTSRHCYLLTLTSVAAVVVVVVVEEVVL